ncbi:RebB family R body protein [Dyella sp. GSA-30]|uniref:RebB family R body protein n=1 Tax=Dyella sp. GSA-30 TaxID=2994496 RepID=UPI00248F90E2|nr:RebB family R body protein [Dyella sp. GSA-30]BDU18965.1 hypothetical protein DYGSA30_04220 [Dyella sp. GSA-30]
MTISPVASNEITDAVTATNTKPSGNTPADALGTIYQAVAHALANAVQSAVNAQQQSYILAQSATMQATMLLLPMGNPNGSMPLDGDKVSAVANALAATAAPDATMGAIAQAVESASKLGLESAGSWSEAVRIIMSTVAIALRELQMASQDYNMAMVKQAAIAAALTAMIKAPDQLEQYQKILGLIQGL